MKLSSREWTRSTRFPNWAAVEPSVIDLTGRQVTVSEGHHWPPPKGETGDVGGPFYTSKSYVQDHPKHASFTDIGWFGTTDRRYSGPLFPTPVFSNNNIRGYFPPDLASSDASLESAGTTAIARCKPTNSPADVATFLGELMKERLPSLPASATWKDRTLSARNAGGEYLNVQFGWRPVVTEITAVAKAISDSDRVLTQYERDAGKVVRRTYRFPKEQSSSESVISTSSVCSLAGNFTDGTNYGVLTRKVETFRERWFAGAFTYAMPYGLTSRSGIAKLAQDAEIIFGVSPSPELIWNLTPWSWAVDWFTNTGDVLSNMSDFVTNGLVLRHGYMMEKSIHKYTYTLSRSGLKAKLPQTVPPLVLITETKKRIPANPFGFGVTWDGLSPFQLSIAAALGISRRR